MFNEIGSEWYTHLGLQILCLSQNLLKTFVADSPPSAKPCPRMAATARDGPRHQGSLEPVEKKVRVDQKYIYM